MPELPEVETVRRGLAPACVGARIVRAEVRRADIRFPFPPRFRERLTGRRIEALTGLEARHHRHEYPGRQYHLDGGTQFLHDDGRGAQYPASR